MRHSRVGGGKQAWPVQPAHSLTLGWQVRTRPPVGWHPPEARAVYPDMSPFHTWEQVEVSSVASGAICAGRRALKNWIQANQREMEYLSCSDDCYMETIIVFFFLIWYDVNKRQVAVFIFSPISILFLNWLNKIEQFIISLLQRLFSELVKASLN